MPEELPLACSLDVGELSDRLAAMSALGRSSLLGVETSARRAELRFIRGGEVADRLAAIVTAEAKCCAFLAMETREEPDALRLIVEAPAGAEPVLQGLVDAFAGGTERVAR